MMKRVVGFGLLVGVLMLATVADAAPILGGISFAGGASPVGPGSPPNWSTSTGATFNNQWQVKSTSGDYSGVPISTPTTFASSINWGSGSGSMNLAIGPITMWSFTIGNLTYTLTVGSVNNIARSAPSNIFVEGAGILTITGGGTNYDPTPGTWSFTGAKGDIFAFTSAAAPVPEPGSMILLGTGLLGLGAAARRRWAKKT